MPTKSENDLTTNWLVERTVHVYTIAVLPLYVLSQWTVLRFGLPGRTVFNLIALIVVAVVLVVGRKRLWRFRTEAIIAAAFVAIVLVSALLNLVSLTVLVRGSLPYLSFAAIALTALVVRIEPRTIQRAIQVAAVTAAISVVAGITQSAFGQTGFIVTAQDLAYPQWWDLGRAVGLVTNPGGFAQLGVLWIALASLGRGSYLTRITLVVSGAMAVGLGVSRTFLFVTIVFLAVWVVVRKVKGSQMLAWGAVAAVGAFVFVQLVTPAAQSNLLDRSATIIEEVTGSGEDDPGSTEERQVVNTRVAGIRAVRELLADRPLLGAGPGQFGSATAFLNNSVVHDEYGLPIPMASQLDVGWAQIAGETGILGAVAAVLLLGAVGIRALIQRAPTAIAIIVLLGISTLTGPGITNITFTVVAMWWFAASMSVSREPLDP